MALARPVNTLLLLASVTFVALARPTRSSDVPCVGAPPTAHGSPCGQLGLNCSGSSELAPAQCRAYQELYDATAGHAWHHCNTTRNDPCNCNGAGAVATFCIGRDLVSVELPQNNMRGTIPDSVGALTALRFLDLSNNGHSGKHDPAYALHGTIPATVGAMTSLEVLQLGGSDWLTGTIPPELGTLTTLKSLYLFHNRLHGTIPAELGALLHLNVFYLYNNLLSGRVPPLNFTKIGRFCGIGDSKGPNDGNKYCTPLPKGASHCNLEGGIKTKGTCAPTPAPSAGL